MRNRLLTGGGLIIALLLILNACGSLELPAAVQEQYAALPAEIDFNRDVKRILSDKCFACHGPDAKKQKADLRLDIASFAYEKVTESGRKAIRPGSLSGSDVVHRILSTDPEVSMPTPESHLELTAYEKAVMVKWIEQGAEYKPHWAFTPPEDADPPRVSNKQWPSNDIDRFILRAMEDKSLSPAPEADRETIIRRLSFDIRGISPSLAEIDAFVNDKSPNAYEKLVDRYLASAHYGERMAAYWLDVARFADSHGYLDDKHRDMSPWRDWVISAYNRNLPFDTFVTWQMAGDLLPNATQEQILATGFNRNHKQNSEAGIIDEEFRVEYVTDRTNTLGSALMAMTLGCAKCHDHKYDPVSQKDYYSLFAFFNSTFEKGGPNYGDERVVPGPTLLLTTPEDDKAIASLSARIREMERSDAAQRKAEEARLAAADEAAVAGSVARKLRARLDFDKAKHKDPQTGEFVNLVDKSSPATFRKAEFGEGRTGRSLKYNDETYVSFPATKVGWFERYEPFSVSVWLKVNEDYPLATIWYSSENHRYGYQGYDLLLRDNRLNFRLSHSFPHDAISVLSKDKVAKGSWNHVTVTYDGSSRADGMAIYLNGKRQPLEVQYDHLQKNIRQHYSIHKGPLIGFSFGWKVLDRSMPRGEIDEFALFDDVLTAPEVLHLQALKPIPSLKSVPVVDTTLRTIRKELCDRLDSVKEVMVMGDLPKPRPTYVLQRGVYDQHGEQVQPGTPSSVLAFPKEYPRNRIGLSKWLFDARNPLTARVAVNRLWQLVFGKGIVATSDDFGNQGALPSHPELLDHLAIRYREGGWDTKAMLKYIFMSSTYRQSAVNKPEIQRADPDNRLLTRSPRYRYPAEMLRDNALEVAGLLSRKIGGPSTYPYQPEGMWDEITDKGWRYRYILSEGEDLFRKSIYTVRKRTSVVPFLQIFDAPDRSTCIVKRQVSSSPMQSLAMLNDPQIVEAARHVALRMQREGGGTIDQQLAWGYRLITGRRPAPKEARTLSELFGAEMQAFTAKPDQARKLLMVGSRPAPMADSVRLASLSNVALTLMNTDEFLTRK